MNAAKKAAKKAGRGRPVGPGGPTEKMSMRLSAATMVLLRDLSDRLGISQSAVVTKALELLEKKKK
jgi:hypothetical protein